MEVEELVDAALVGFDRREPVTIPRCMSPNAGMLWRVHAKVLCRIFDKPMPLNAISLKPEPCLSPD